MVRTALLPLALIGVLAWPAVAQEGGQVFRPMDQFVVRPLADAGLEPYAHAIASLALWALLMAALLTGSTLGKARARTESGMIVRDYSDPAYRRDRAFRNAIESNGMFVAAVVACILAGASPFLTNLLASVFVVARVAMAAVHVFTENQPMRSAFWSVGALCILGLAVMGLGAALW